MGAVPPGRTAPVRWDLCCPDGSQWELCCPDSSRAVGSVLPRRLPVGAVLPGQLPCGGICAAQTAPSGICAAQTALSKSHNGRDVTKWAIIDVNSIVSGRDYDILTSIIAIILPMGLSLNCSQWDLCCPDGSQWNLCRPCPLTLICYQQNETPKELQKEVAKIGGTLVTLSMGGQRNRGGFTEPICDYYDEPNHHSHPQ